MTNTHGTPLPFAPLTHPELDARARSFAWQTVGAACSLARYGDPDPGLTIVLARAAADYQDALSVRIWGGR